MNHTVIVETIILVCHVISQNHVIKGSFNFVGTSPLREVIILPSLVATGPSECDSPFYQVWLSYALWYYGSRDIIALVSHVTLQDHMIKGSCDFMGRSPSK